MKKSAAQKLGFVFLGDPKPKKPAMVLKVGSDKSEFSLLLYQANCLENGDIVFGNPVASLTKDEYLVFAAFSVSFFANMKKGMEDAGLDKKKK